MAVTVRWHFHDLSRTSAMRSVFDKKGTVDLGTLDVIFKKAAEEVGKRPVMMSVRLDGADGKQIKQQIGPVAMKDAMALVLQEMVDTDTSLEGEQMGNARRLAEDGYWNYKPVGRFKENKSVLLMKNVDSETHEVWTDEKLTREVDKAAGRDESEKQTPEIRVGPSDVEIDFDEELMQPENLEKCLEYWQLAKDAYSEDQLREGLWEINSDGFRVIGKFGMVEDTLEIWISFRGTSNAVEAIMDGHVELVPFILEESRESEGRVHLGFLLGFQYLRPLLFAKLADELRGKRFRKVLFNITGHSFGGALATLSAYQLAAAVGNFELLGMLREINSELRCVTWGSPKVGNAAFRQNYRSQVPCTARIVNRWDIVPLLPPCGRVEEDFLFSGDPKDDQLGLLHMRSLLVGLSNEVKDLANKETPAYVHVVDAIRLDMSHSSRLSRAFGCFTIGSSCMQQGCGWVKTSSNWGKVFGEAASPHTLPAYRSNLIQASPSEALAEFLIRI